MLHSAKRMQGYAVIGSDGKVGSIDDLYFDDSRWTVRYLVVHTSGWLRGRRVLIPPAAVHDWQDKALQLRLTRQQIRDSPGIESDAPVSRQHESDMHRYYGFTEYWTGPYLWGYESFPGLIDSALMENQSLREADEQPEQCGDAHLRSCREVIGYDMRTTDDRIGHVVDFLFDERDWSIRLMVVDPRNWWPGKHVLVPPQRIERVDWESGVVQVKLARDELDASPEYDSMNPPPPPLPDQLQQVYRQVETPPEWP